ncbi:MAG TPA: Ni/Fe hydrogenase [Sulfurospirillum arcachonense]|nr:Ni/Fe hydrogenase [Sulfurospirillum arcachonense]
MKKITKELLQRIEGEATLELDWEDDKISYAKIKFLNFRGIEKILENRPFLDALAITPRVCGICNTSHIIAAINAIEDAYMSMGVDIKLSKKAKQIREFALNAEKIQNHIKWLYFSILPEILELNGEDDTNIKAFEGKDWIKAQKICSEILKAMAIFTGQWPHGSFCMIGGVTCDPTRGDIYEAMRYLENVIEFCEKEIFGVSIEEFLSFDSSVQLMGTTGSLQKTVGTMVEHNVSHIGKSYDRFISLGESSSKKRPKKCLVTRVINADISFVSESLKNSFFEEDGYTYSKSAMYKNKYFETGPIARMMIVKNPLIRDFHRKYKDSILTRVVARVSEVAHLLNKSKKILEKIKLSEPSCISPSIPYGSINATGIGRCEAARGSLLHKIEITRGMITSYDIITPTVWNLGNGSKEEPAIAQKALMGIEEICEADLVFKAFDVCAVCTTQ